MAPNARLSELFWRLSLWQRFALLALGLSVISTLAIGGWVSSRIETTIRLRDSRAAAIYMSHLLTPMVRDLVAGSDPSDERRKEFESFMKVAPRLDVKALKIWDEQGRIIYSSRQEIIGEVFERDDRLIRAFAGEVTSEFNEPSLESAIEFSQDDNLLEVYVPIYSADGEKIAAVAEVYEDARDLREAITTAKRETWLITSAVLILNFLALSTIVGSASRTIESQKLERIRRIGEISLAMQRESELRGRLERSAKHAKEENERYLTSIGADLHDGPAQLIGLAMLNLGLVSDSAAGVGIAAVRANLVDAMREIRCISGGLLLPNVADQPLSESIAATIRTHETRTATAVELVMREIPDHLPIDLKICVCRILQEALTNSYRHAKGVDQKVVADGTASQLRIEVSDRGPGMPESYASFEGSRLGLIGLRSRLECIGGTLSVASDPMHGTSLVAWLPIEGDRPNGC